MENVSLSDRIAKYLQGKGWTNGGEIEREAMIIGYKASNASRRCRELVNDGILERKEHNGSVWYRSKVVEPKQMELV